MNEIIKALFAVVIITFIPILAYYIGRAVDSYGEKHNIEEITNVISEAVRSTSQVYVDELKERDIFDADAQEQALRTAVDTAIKILSPAAETYIEENYGDITPYLIPKIEAEVKRQKNNNG